MAAASFKGDSLRQRLVGGVALLIIGVIAWFWLLSADSPIDPVSRVTQIPPAPDIKPFVVPAPTPPAEVAPIGSERDSQPALQADVAAAKAVAVVPVAHQSAAPKKAPEHAVAAKTQRDTFELDQHGLPVAWVVQVGLFATQASAERIKTTLQQHGFKAFTEPYKTPNTPTGIKVFVGPKLSRERADAQKRAIDTALKVNSMVVRFQPPQH